MENHDLKEGEKYYASFVFIDYVSSTKLMEVVGEEEVKRRMESYRNTVEGVFEKFGGIRGEWKGEGNNFFFFSNKVKDVEDTAVRASIECLKELRTKSDVETRVRISIGAGIIEYKNELGKIDSHKISLAGHLKSACAENSILITEDVYFGLSKELRDKFKPCGMTKRDKILTFIYPPEKESEIKKENFLDEEKDYSKEYLGYIRFIEDQNRTLLITGVGQIEETPTDLEESFFPLRLERKEEIIEEIIEEKERIIERTISENFIDVIRKNKYVVILGDPGTGKTTILRYIALIFSRGLK
ncbi:MAG: hypothetical protein ACK4YO_01145, partial [Candidatus Altarchaeaceae archaeon]